MIDDQRLLNRLGAHLDAPDGPPATLRDRVMAELASESRSPRQAVRRRWSLQWPQKPGRSSQTRWLLPATAAAVVAAALVSAAGGLLPDGGTPLSRSPGSAPTSAAAMARKVDTSVFQSGSSDFMVFESPADLAKAEGITSVFAGEVKGFSQGRVVSSPGLEEKHVVMQVSLSETYESPRDGDAFAYVELPQPTCAGDIPCATVADFTKAIPAGTKVLVFGEDAAEVAPPGGWLTNNNAGRPAGTRLIRPNPQGLLFESATATGATVVGAYEQVENMPEGWRRNPSAGIAGLRAQLKAAGIGN
ncbi:hypothetical protein [Actinoplanes sp. CA-252034]|uniref:hypothetical protein n=1 Tax=Actinoplanes sp. CA-252034 TaxID=3239906 RepID=UPI003D99ABAC